MPKFLHRAIACVLLLSTMTSVAADDPAARLRDQLQKKFPDIQVRDVVPSQALPGFYEVLTPAELAYVSADGERLILGSVLDVASQRNLTAERWSDLNRIDLKSLPLNKAIVIRKGKGERKLVVFADPLCPYCQQLEQQLVSATNVTMHVLPFPLESVHPGAKALARNIWCAADKTKAWTEWMVHKIAPAECSNPQLDKDIQDVVALGEQLNVNVTPTLVLSDGRRIPGLVSNERLEQEWSRQVGR